jgi:hypothetical protein
MMNTTSSMGVKSISSSSAGGFRSTKRRKIVTPDAFVLI